MTKLLPILFTLGVSVLSISLSYAEPHLSCQTSATSLIDTIAMPPGLAQITRRVTRQSESYLFEITSDDLGKVQQVKNCIVYTTCVGHSDIAYTQQKTGWQLNLRVLATPEQIEQIMNGCPWSKLPGSVKAYDEATKASVAVPVHEVSDLEIANYQKKLNPVILEDLPTSVKVAGIARIQALIDQRNYRAAIAEAKRVFNIQSPGYDVSYVNDLNKMLASKVNASCLGQTFRSSGVNSTTKGASVTYELTEESRRIEIYPGAMKHACTLISTLRHESEHAFQLNRNYACRIERGGDLRDSNEIPFSDTDSKAGERSAALNDYFQADSICPSEHNWGGEAQLAAEWYFNLNL